MKMAIKIKQALGFKYVKVKLYFIGMLALFSNWNSIMTLLQLENVDMIDSK